MVKWERILTQNMGLKHLEGKDLFSEDLVKACVLEFPFGERIIFVTINLTVRIKKHLGAYEKFNHVPEDGNV